MARWRQQQQPALQGLTPSLFMHIQRALRLSAAALLFSLPGLAVKAQTPVTVAGTTPGQFSVSESGAATYRIPIQVPPGVAGMEPRLELAYNSQGGNGLLGMGWSMSGLSAITRCPAIMPSDGIRGAVNYDLNDRFCLDGQRLILVAGSYGVAGSEYRTELESFSKITAYGAAGNGPASFTVKTKAGLTVEYGNTTDSRVEAQGKATVRVWAQNKVTDVKGNFLTVSYFKSAYKSVQVPTAIRYGGNATSGTLSNLSVSFGYDTTRMDKSEGYVAGSLVQINRRVVDIKTYSGTDLIKDYRLAYVVQATAIDKSHLATFTECDGAGMCLPAHSVNWDAMSSDAFAPATNWNAYFGVVAGGWRDSNIHPRQVADVNGDGLPDIVGFSDAGVMVALNTGTSFAPATNWNAYFGVVAGGWRDSNINPRQVADVNGDGLPDIVGFGDAGVMVALNTGASFAPATNWNAYFGVVAGGWSNSDIYPRQVADVNGDGLPDIVGFSSVGVMVALNTGTSFAPATNWNAYSSATAGGWHDSNINPRQVADVNGDGLPDIVGFSDAGVMVALNTGTLFLPAANWNAYFGVTAGGWSSNNIHPRQVADVNGDGLPDIVGFSDAGVIVATNARKMTNNYVNNIVNGNGLANTPTYRTLTSGAVYMKDSGANKATYPKVDLQFPLYVVASVASSNGVGGVNTTSYSYGGLKAEQGTGRGMLGFRWIKSKEEASGIERYSEFSQTFPYTGMPVKSETRLAGAAGVLKRTSATPACQIPQTAATCAVAAGNRYFAYVASSAEESWDLNGAAYPSVTSSFAYGQSPQYGDPTQITVSTSGGASKTTNNEYYPADTLNWVLGRLKKASVTSVQP